MSTPQETATALRMAADVYEAKGRDATAMLMREAATTIDTLQRWKTEMIQVEETWDVQAIGKLLGVPVGRNIRPAIQPAIERQLAAIGAIRAAIEDCLNDR